MCEVYGVVLNVIEIDSALYGYDDRPLGAHRLKHSSAQPFRSFSWLPAARPLGSGACESNHESHSNTYAVRERTNRPNIHHTMGIIAASLVCSQAFEGSAHTHTHRNAVFVCVRAICAAALCRFVSLCVQRQHKHTNELSSARTHTHTPSANHNFQPND